GLACLCVFGKLTLILGLLLALTVLVYDAVHKIFAFSPVLMAACRFFLVLTAASIPSDAVSGLAVWTALVLGCYIVGLSCIARRETGSGPLSYWPCLFLAAPVLLALLENSGPSRGRSILLCTLLTFWIVRCLRFSLWAPQRNIGRT